MQKILITGACGYVGSQLLQSLESISNPLEISVLDNFSTGAESALQNLPAQHKWHLLEGDILNPHLVDMALRGVDVVIHLAAVVQTPMSFGNSSTLEQVNHWGSISLMEKALKNKVQHFIFTSSTSVYGPISEEIGEHQFRPFGPYAISKFHAEQSADPFRKRGLNVSILRLASVYGKAPVTRYDAFVNRLIHLGGTKKMLTIHGNGEQTRPCIHVEDAADAILFAMSNPDAVSGKNYNVLEDNYSVFQVAKAIQEAENQVELRYIEQDIRNRYNFKVVGDLLNETGWKPKQNLSEICKILMEDYKAFDKIKFS